MKKILTIIILSLCFISSVQADDIRDFQIEGISVGDSLLNFYSEKKIKRYDPLYYPASKKFYQIVILIKNGRYDALNINVKEGDKKYIVHSIKGLKNYDNRHKDCLEEKKNILSEISSIAKNTKKKNTNLIFLIVLENHLQLEQILRLVTEALQLTVQNGIKKIKM